MPIDIDWPKVTAIKYGKDWSDFPDLEGYYYEYWWRIEYGAQIELYDVTLLNRLEMAVKLKLKKNINALRIYGQVRESGHPTYFTLFSRNA